MFYRRTRSRGEAMPFTPGVLQPNAPPPGLWGVNFWNATPGATSLSAFGLTFTRASVATVQTSASTLAADIAVDTPRIFYDGTRRGLLLEEARTQYLAKSNVFTDSSIWLAPSAAPTDSGIVGPDGTAASQRIAIASGATAVYQTTPSLPLWKTPYPSRYSPSVWVRETPSATGGAYIYTHSPATNTTSSSGTAPSTWTRKLSTWNVTQASAGTANFLLNDGRNRSGDLNAGLAAGARDSLFAYAQLENGGYPTSDIVNTGGAGTTATRAQEYLYIPDASAYIPNGRISIYIVMYMQSNFYDVEYDNGDRAGHCLFSLGAVNNCEGFFEGGSSAVNSRMTFWHTGVLLYGLYGYYDPAGERWVRGDKMEFFFRGGAGNTSIRIRRNGILTFSQSSATVNAAINLSSPQLNLFKLPSSLASTGRAFPGIVESVTLYDNTTLPGAWAA